MGDTAKTVVITGAGSGFGALAARALARAGHTVYAAMRDTTGRNGGRVADARAYAVEHGVDLRTVELDVLSRESADADVSQVADAVVAVVNAPYGQRPFRVHVDPANDGSEEVGRVADRIRGEFLTRIGLADLLAPHIGTSATSLATTPGVASAAVPPAVPHA